ncbi:MAG: hypothetical protein ABIZ04_21485 [Opitutus sp.]
MFAPRLSERSRTWSGALRAAAAAIPHAVALLASKLRDRVIVPAAEHIVPGLVGWIRHVVRELKHRMHDPLSRWNQIPLLHRSTVPSKVEFLIERMDAAEEMRRAKLVREFVPKLGRQILRNRTKH